MLDQMKQELKAATERYNKEREFIREKKQQIAEYCCPFKVGDKVVSPRGENQIVASISHTNYAPYYKFMACKIKKNGDPYVQSIYAFGYENYKKADEAGV